MSSTPPHLLVAISGHGFGHLAQVAPVLEALARRLPNLQLTLRCSLPEPLLRRRIGPPFALIAGAPDFGMRMHSALSVDVDASAADYAAFHRDWPRRVADEAALIARCGAQAVLADIPYLSLAAAAAAGCPAVALCSLNWATIYGHYCSHRPEAAAIIAQITEAYRSAELFLLPEPAMPMPELGNTQPIGPITQTVPRCREQLRAALGLAPGQHALLIGMGGVGVELPIARWPRFPGWRLIVPQVDTGGHPDVTTLEQLGWEFPRLLGGVDALLTKPGYGSYVEAAAQGLPVLYASRPDWPEEPWLNPWLERHTRAAELPIEALHRGDFIGPLQTLMARPAPPPATANGAAEAAAAIAGRLLTQSMPAMQTATR